MFSAGWDLPLLVDRDRKAHGGFVGAYCDLVRQLFVFGPPVVAALPGHAIAGGLIFAMAADERIAAEGKGKFGLSEVILGVSVPQCLMEPFRHVLGPRVMERLAATGENRTSTGALAVGLSTAPCRADELLDAAVERARVLAGLSARPTPPSSGAREPRRWPASTRRATTTRSWTSGSAKTRGSGSATWWRG